MNHTKSYIEIYNILISIDSPEDLSYDECKSLINILHGKRLIFNEVKK
jgi:hypothetical protein